MTQAELLRHVAGVFEDLGVTYMIGGSQAAVYYGDPRFTQDIDVVTDLGLEHIPALIDRFPAGEFYMSEESAREAVETRGQFNIIHPSSGLKIDVFVNKDTDYDRLRLDRRQRLPLVPGREAYFARHSLQDALLPRGPVGCARAGHPRHREGVRPRDRHRLRRGMGAAVGPR